MLYQAARSAGIDGLIHLTTRQTPADRRKILTDVRQRLEEEEPCRVVATSLVEAGVDIDFPKVWRAEAGLDQLTQPKEFSEVMSSRCHDTSLGSSYNLR